MNAVRVVVADDDVLLREGLASLLGRSGFDVVGQAGDATELLDAVRELQPDLAVVDIRMPPTHGTEGLDAAKTIRQEWPEIAILVLSAHVDVDHAMELIVPPLSRLRAAQSCIYTPHMGLVTAARMVFRR